MTLALRSGVLAMALLLGAGAARAEGGDPIAVGQDLARKGDFAGAVTQFLVAERQTPTADTACLLGLAEHRRGNAGQSEQWFALCHLRGTTTGTVPAWAAAIEQELAPELAPLAAVTVRIDPPSPRATIGIVGWDLPVQTTRVHLAPGHYMFTLQIEGSARTEVPVDITGGGAREVVLTPAPETHGPAIDPVGPPPPPRAEHSPVRTSTLVVGAGIAALAAGAILDVTIVKSRYDTLDAKPTVGEYDAYKSTYRHAQIGTIAVLSVGAAAVVAGIVMRTHEHSPTAPQLGAILGPQGGMVTVGWSN